MAEYIEREAAMRELMNDAPEQVGYSREDAADCIRYMDAADVAPVVHGRWLPYQTPVETRQSGWICNQCSGVAHDLSNGDTDYCPNCGARMDLEVSDGKS